MNKHAELQNQINGLKHALEQMEYGIENNDIRFIAAEVGYLEEKSKCVLNEAKILLNERED